MTRIIDREILKSRFKSKASELFRQAEASAEHLIVTDGGRAVRYDRPTDPVAENDWDVLG